MQPRCVDPKPDLVFLQHPVRFDIPFKTISENSVQNELGYFYRVDLSPRIRLSSNGLWIILTQMKHGTRPIWSQSDSAIRERRSGQRRCYEGGYSQYFEDAGCSL